jgi:Cu/Ag efflux protein CusF
MAKTLKELLDSFDFNRAALAKQRLYNLRKSGRRVRGASIANLMRAAGLREEEMDEEDLDQLDEVLAADATASDWIHDFVHSTNPKFDGKSKKDRIKMALGAYYHTHRNKDGEGFSEKVNCSDKYMKKEELVGNQHKLDKNKNGKLDAQDFKKLRKEETQIDEVSKSTLMRYIPKASRDVGSHVYAGKESGEWASHYTKAGDWENAERQQKNAKKSFDKANKRIKGIDTATKKLGTQKEEVEQIDELSKKTLGSYVNKAAKDSRYSGQIATDFENQADKSRKKSKKDSFERLHRKYLEKSWKREDGIAKAVGKLTKEEVLDEAGKVYDPFSKKMVPTKPIKVQAGGGATRNGVPVETGASKYKSKLPMSKAAGVLAAEEVQLIDEGKMKDIYTDMMHHATKKGYSSHKEFTPADYETIGKQHGISGKELAVIAGHKTAQQVSTHFKKPVQSGKEMDRARALAQRGMQSLSKEEVERIEEKLAQMDESWHDGIVGDKSVEHRMAANKHAQEAKTHKEDAKEYDKADPSHHEAMARHHNAMAKWTKATYHLGHQGNRAEAEKKANQHLKTAAEYEASAKEKLGEEIELDERNKQNALMRKTMDASRGARFKINNPVPPAEPEHKTAQAHNKAIGRALRNEDLENEEIQMEKQITFAEFLQLNEMEFVNGRYVHKGTYGTAKGAKYGNTDYERETLDNKDDDETNEIQKRGRGRPAGAKSGARGPRVK